MKKSKTIALLITPVLSTLLFSACNRSEPSTTRDVYQNRDECLKDWGDQELCQEMNDGDSDDYRRTSGGVFVGRPYWGPQYYPGDRSVSYKGRTFAPTTKSSSMPSYVVTSRSSVTSRSGVSSPTRSSSTSYGGFGGSRSSGGGYSSSS